MSYSFLPMPGGSFDAIVELLRDREWQTPDELASKTRYADQWIRELRRESVLEVDEQDGRTLVRWSRGLVGVRSLVGAPCGRPRCLAGREPGVSSPSPGTRLQMTSPTTLLRRPW
jgi:hypothetical protein